MSAKIGLRASKREVENDKMINKNINIRLKAELLKIVSYLDLVREG